MTNCVKFYFIDVFHSKKKQRLHQKKLYVWNNKVIHTWRFMLCTLNSRKKWNKVGNNKMWIECLQSICERECIGIGLKMQNSLRCRKGKFRDKQKGLRVKMDLITKSTTTTLQLKCLSVYNMKYRSRNKSQSQRRALS